jgi:succinyl-diaminopimelate desuccinylase
MQNPSPHAAAHLRALIACRSVTPADDGAQAYVAGVLKQAGFSVESLSFSAPGTPEIQNLFATIGSGAPHLVFVGHTDVVPPGDEARWSHPPFAAEVADGVMFGRGAVDMKGAIACFLSAALSLVAASRPKGTLSLLITGDEEGPAINGTEKVIEWTKTKGLRFDGALVGEPTSRERLGDNFKMGRRGSLSGTIIVRGVQGHAAYPHLADNPIPTLARILARLTSLKLDDGNSDFEPSNLEITGIEADSTTFNVIPAEARARFNIRFNDFWSTMALNALLRHEIAEVAGGDCEIAFERPSEWFLTKPGPLAKTLSDGIRAITGTAPEASTGGGTSDARFFKAVCPVVEFGLVGQSMHQIDERVPLADLEQLTTIYRAFLDGFFGQAR